MSNLQPELLSIVHDYANGSIEHWKRIFTTKVCPRLDIDHTGRVSIDPKNGQIKWFGVCIGTKAELLEKIGVSDNDRIAFIKDYFPVHEPEDEDDVSGRYHNEICSDCMVTIKHLKRHNIRALVYTEIDRDLTERIIGWREIDYEGKCPSITVEECPSIGVIFLERVCDRHSDGGDDIMVDVLEGDIFSCNLNYILRNMSDDKVLAFDDDIYSRVKALSQEEK